MENSRMPNEKRRAINKIYSNDLARLQEYKIKKKSILKFLFLNIVK